MFRDVGWPRLLTMTAFLVVLGMMFVRARDPATWQWLAEMQEPAETADAASADVPADDAAADAVSEGPTDEDPEQWAEAEEQFQAVSDGTLGNQGADMFAYWRLLLWADHQSFADLWQRAKPAARYNDFMQFPDEHRGELVRFDMHVVRVIPFDAPPTCPLEVERLYEIWGHTDQSKSWPVWVVAARLPAGIPVGDKVQGRARFTGYFFKLQGYQDAYAKPRDAPLRMPLFLGRVQPILLAGPAEPTWDSSWLVPAGGALLLLFSGAVAWSILRGRQAARRRAAQPVRHDVDLNAWLGRGNTPAADEYAEEDEYQENEYGFNPAEPDGPRTGVVAGRPSDNGHNRGGLPSP
jgi:hypothetical protein